MKPASPNDLAIESKFHPRTIINYFRINTICHFILITFLAFSCKKSEEGNTQSINTSGKFAFSMLNNLKSANVNPSTDSTSFVLDTIKSSRSFYFILANAGQTNITNVSISSDNINFNITPSIIANLPAVGIVNSTSSLIQVIELDVIHGIRINGVGYTGLLPMGNNTCHITITGNTSNGKDSINLKYIAKINVFAKVMNITLSQGNSEINLLKPNGAEGAGYTSGFMNLYNCNSSPALYLKNTGNVSIAYSLLNNITQSPPVLQSSIVNVNDSVAIDINLFPFGLGNIQLDSNGTIFDQTKIALGTNGDGYLALMNVDYSQISPIDTTHSDSTKNLRINKNNKYFIK